MKKLLGLLFIIGFAGCATILKGPKQEVEFSCDSINVDVYANTKRLGKTPVSMSLYKAKKNQIDLVLPNGQTHNSLLKTKLNTAIWGDIPFFLIDPYLGGCVMAFDYFTGSGKSFVPATITISDESSVELTTIFIKPKPVEPPKRFVNLATGLGICVFPSNEENEIAYIPELSIENVYSFRDIYQIGLGVNLQGTRKPSKKEEVNILPLYFTFKITPFKLLKIKPYIYILGHIGSGFAWGRYENEWRVSPAPIIYLGCGCGFELNEILYFEYIIRVSTFISLPSERIGYSSYAILIGHRFDFK